MRKFWSLLSWTFIRGMEDSCSHPLVLAYQFLGSYLGQTADIKKPMLNIGFILDVLD
ncbi:hypothetical protein [Vibrio bathopelagicus]|uniref:hypothetical protein n=1 Tax=Vibrio bathopelagicus TaxID=2777577 RepID=UPI001863DCE4|nr:hypothetical protein [Vibrio bathopelagicus]